MWHRKSGNRRRRSGNGVHCAPPSATSFRRPSVPARPAAADRSAACRRSVQELVQDLVQDLEQELAQACPDRPAFVEIATAPAQTVAAPEAVESAPVETELVETGLVETGLAAQALPVSTRALQVAAPALVVREEAALELEAPAPDASASAGRPAVLAPAALQDFSSDGLSATPQDRRLRRCRSTQ